MALYSNGERIFESWEKEYKGQLLFIHDHLMKLGKDGWELVSVYKTGANPNFNEYIFKRPIQ